MIHQAITNIAALCAAHGVQKAILSPGSRCAPLTLAFTRHPAIECYTISDERSAAFIALGMAQASSKPVVLVCTSGSAAYNYAPAVAEAYFQNVPLLILTADRPPEWVDQWDGQTIRQEAIYGRHVKKSFNFPVDTSHPDAKVQANRIINEAILLTNEYGNNGPVHVNIPIREPFYPEKNEQWTYDSPRIVQSPKAQKSLSQPTWDGLAEEFRQIKQPLIVLGQKNYDLEFLALLNTVSKKLSIPVIADIISNGHQLENAIRLSDLIFMRSEKLDFQPDLIISFGKSIISKNLKLFLRNANISQWHVQLHNDLVADPFSALQKLIQSDDLCFVENMQQYFKPVSNRALQTLISKQAEMQKNHKSFFQKHPFSEFTAVYRLMNLLPEGAHLHLANSMSVRYANFIGLNSFHDVKVWANRGTSGIDGSNSTAMGHALSESSVTHFLITGDVAFFYDRNAFWHNYAFPNLKILLLNNHGGTIFGMINGPKSQKELGEYFETKQALGAKHLANEFGIRYLEAHDEKSLTEGLSKLVGSSNAMILEVKSTTKESQELFEKFKNTIKSI